VVNYADDPELYDAMGKWEVRSIELTEGAVKTIQCFAGFELDGRVSKKLWDFIFSVSNIVILANINMVSKYDENTLEKIEDDRMGYSLEGGHVDVYFKNGETKMAILQLFGETYQLFYSIYYLSLNYYFIVVKEYRSPFIFWVPPEVDDPESYETTTYRSYLKIGDYLFQLIDGEYTDTNFNLNRILSIVEGRPVSR